jgi:hypothetical protein
MSEQLPDRPEQLPVTPEQLPDRPEQLPACLSPVLSTQYKPGGETRRSGLVVMEKV